MPTKCLIYCRVSSQRQVEEGHGIDSQAKRCADYANSKGYIISKIFKDEGVSGGLLERPKMQELINYLDKHPTERYVVIFDDLARFARDVLVHLKLKIELVQKRSVKLECLNFNFEDSPIGDLVEIILAGVSEFHRKDNTRQVIQKMKARVEQGYWCFRSPPLGLSYINDAIHGKLLKAVEPYASIFKEAILGYARGILNTLEEVREFIERKYNEHSIKRNISINGAQSILRQLLYTGYLEYKPWGISLIKGKHEGFIDLETYKIVQEKLNGKSKFAARKDYNLDFPLRGFVLCDNCGEPMTAAWCKGRMEKYPKYWCKNKKCLVRQIEAVKSVPKNVIEKQFEALLETQAISAETLDLATDVVLNAWENRERDNLAKQAYRNKRLNEINDAIADFTDQTRTKKSENDLILAKVYEDRIRTLAKEKEKLEETNALPTYTKDELRTATNFVMDTLKEPIRMWRSEIYKEKRAIFQMYFEEKLRYDLRDGFRTARLSLPVALIKNSEEGKTDLVEMPGVEPGSGKTPL